MTGPDPLADALEPNAAQRAYLDMAAETGRKYHGWAVTWDLEGFRARRGMITLGPASTQAVLEAVLDSLRQLPAETFTATWEQGSGHLTIACPHGRQWCYDVIPVGGRPLQHFLWELPWMLPPGAQWAEDGAEGVWSAMVVPESPGMAGKLFAVPVGAETFRSAGETDSSQLPSGD